MRATLRRSLATLPLSFPAVARSLDWRGFSLFGGHEVRAARGAANEVLAERFMADHAGTFKRLGD
jgi:hypothetical protein